MSGAYAKVFAAFRAAQVPDREAAEAADALLAVRDDDIRSIRSDLKDLRQGLADTRSDVRLLKWQIGFSIALSLAVIGLLLRLMLKLGAL